MERDIKLSIPDQTPVRNSSNAREALQESAELERLTDKLSYTRYWMSKHHNKTIPAGPAPKILIVRIANKTSRMRAGSGKDR